MHGHLDLAIPMAQILAVCSDSIGMTLSKWLPQPRGTWVVSQERTMGEETRKSTLRALMVSFEYQS